MFELSREYIIFEVQEVDNVRSLFFTHTNNNIAYYGQLTILVMPVYQCL